MEKSLRCSKCSRLLDTIGNVSYGNARLSWAIRKWTLILVGSFSAIALLLSFFIKPDTPGAFILSLPLFWYGYYGILIIPIFLLTTLIPNTTKISCHHCGHFEEKVGKAVERSYLPKAKNNTPTFISVNNPKEVKIDNSFISPETTIVSRIENSPTCPACGNKLSETGNFTLRTPHWVNKLRKSVVIGYPAVLGLIILTALNETGSDLLTKLLPDWFGHPLIFFAYFPLVIALYLITSWIPKATHLHCHHCKHHEEMIMK